MPDNKKVKLRIEKATAVRSKHFGRYGIKFLLSKDNDLKTPIFHSIWFGNFEDFQNDTPEKSFIIWNMANDFIEKIKSDKKYLNEPEKLVGIEFYGIFKFDPESGFLYLDKVVD